MSKPVRLLAKFETEGEITECKNKQLTIKQLLDHFCNQAQWSGKSCNWGADKFLLKFQYWVRGVF